MSTEIHKMEGTHHDKVHGDFSVTRDKADLYLTRFFNGAKIGRQVQLTISQYGMNGTTSYIHLSKEQCEELAGVLLCAFDDNIYPSE